MKKNIIIIATFLGIIIISALLIFSNIFSNPLVYIHVEESTTAMYLEPIFINITLSNEDSQELSINDFSIDYNIEVHIYDTAGRHIKNLFRRSMPTPNITIAPKESYTKMIDLRENMDFNYWYINDELDKTEELFIFEPGHYRARVYYIDRNGLETDPPLYKSNEFQLTITSRSC